MQKQKLDNNNSDYKWNEPETCAHEYILPILERIFSEFKFPKDVAILDAGCGGGYLMNKIYEKGYGRIWGFDISQEAINVARSNYVDIADRFEVHDAYEKNLPRHFSQNLYDIILSIEVIEHLYNPNTYLDNVSFWLKKNGIFIISTPYHGFLKNLGIVLLNKFDKHFTTSIPTGHIKFFSKRTLYEALHKAGIRPIKFYGCGRMSWIWKSMITVGIK